MSLYPGRCSNNISSLMQSFLNYVVYHSYNLYSSLYNFDNEWKRRKMMIDGSKLEEVI